MQIIHENTPYLYHTHARKTAKYLELIKKNLNFAFINLF